MLFRSWNDPNWFSTQRDYISSGIVSVKADVNDFAGLASDSGLVWTIVSLNNGQGPLPVELITFNAKQVDQKVKIWWDVESENNVAKYAVERTTDYSFMNEIANILPQGPSAGLLHYETWDAQPLPGLQYYRLRTTGKDGNVQHSQFVPVNFNGSTLLHITSLNPDANRSNLIVNYYYSGTEPLNYVVTDVMGKTICKGTANKSQGENKLELPLNLSTGLYLFSISNSSMQVTSKFRY